MSFCKTSKDVTIIYPKKNKAVNGYDFNVNEQDQIQLIAMI